MDVPYIARLLRDLIVWSSGAAIVLCLLFAFRDARAVRSARRFAWFVGLWVCLATTIGLVAEAVFKGPGIPAEWRPILYAGAMVGLGVSLLGIAFTFRRSS